MEASDSDGTAERTWETEDPMDLSDWSTVEIEWENLGDYQGPNRSRLVVDVEKDGDSDEYEDRINEPGDFDRRVDSLDVSDVYGERHVRVHARDTQPQQETTSEIRIFRVRLLR